MNKQSLLLVALCVLTQAGTMNAVWPFDATQKSTQTPVSKLQAAKQDESKTIGLNPAPAFVYGSLLCYLAHTVYQTQPYKNMMTSSGKAFGIKNKHSQDIYETLVGSAIQATIGGFGLYHLAWPAGKRLSASAQTKFEQWKKSQKGQQQLAQASEFVGGKSVQENALKPVDPETAQGA